MNAYDQLIYIIADIAELLATSIEAIKMFALGALVFIIALIAIGATLGYLYVRNSNYDSLERKVVIMFGGTAGFFTALLFILATLVTKVFF